MSTAVAPLATKRVIGGSFLLEDVKPADIFTLEDLTEEQQQRPQTSQKKKSWPMSMLLRRRISPSPKVYLGAPESWA